MVVIIMGAPPSAADSTQWRVLAAPSLEVRYLEGNNEDVANAVRDKATVFMEEVSTFLGVYTEGRYSIVLADSAEQFRDLQPTMRAAPEWAGALSYPGLRLVLIQTPAALKTTGDRYWALLHHEMVHAVMGDAEIRAGVRLPRWFAEGVASYVAGEMTLPRFLSLSWAQVAGNIVPFEDLEMDFPADPGAADVAYARSYLFVKYVTRRFGEDGIARLFSASLESGSLEAGMAKAFGLSRAELLVGFDQYSRVKTTWVPLITSTGAIWGVITLLFLTTYFRKRLLTLRTLDDWDLEESSVKPEPSRPEEEKDGPRTLH